MNLRSHSRDEILAAFGCPDQRIIEVDSGDDGEDDVVIQYADETIDDLIQDLRYYLERDVPEYWTFREMDRDEFEARH